MNHDKTGFGDSSTVKCKPQVGTKLVDFRDPGTEYQNNCVSRVQGPMDGTRTDWCDGDDSSSPQSVINIVTEDENRIPNLSELSRSTNSRDEPSCGLPRRPETSNVVQAENIYIVKSPLDEGGFGNKIGSYRGQSSEHDDDQKDWEYFHLKDESFAEVSWNGCSTDGTAGSARSGEALSLDSEDPNDNNCDNVDETLSENLEVRRNSDDHPNENELQTEYVERVNLTLLNLEALNCSELDRTECVRNFIQAMEPPEIKIGEETWSPASLNYYEIFGPDDEVFDKDNLELRQPPRLQDHEEEENLFSQHSFKKVFKPRSSYRNGYKYDRALSSTVSSTRTCEAVGENTFSRNDDDYDEGSWSRSVGWSDSKSRLTFPSLSTINEESDDDKEPILHRDR